MRRGPNRVRPQHVVAVPGWGHISNLIIFVKRSSYFASQKASSYPKILELILELKEQFGTAVLMITRDLGVIAEIAQRVMVMYAGKVVEEGPTHALFDDPKRPYTKGLLKSIPVLGRRAMFGRDRLTEIPGMVPSLYALPQGCSFQPRCLESIPECTQIKPELKPLGNGRSVRCHLY